MIRGRLALVAGALVLATLAVPARDARAMQDGGRISTRIAVPGAVTFDPPLTFGSTLPLQGSYLNARTGMSFLGTGAVLDATGSSFGVTGLLPGGFLAFDCRSRNADGSVPRLPMRIRFSHPVAGVSMNVGSLASAGSAVSLAAFDARGHPVARQSVIAGPAIQGIAVAVPTPRIASVTLSGPCNLAVDDIIDSEAEASVR